MKKKTRITLSDYLRANRMARRELEQSVRGAGFHSMHRVHKSVKQYVRNLKHKKRLEEE